MAGIGPSSIFTGSQPTEVWSTIRARGGEPQRFGLLARHQQHRGGAVGDLRGVAGGDAAVGLERRLELGERLERRVRPDALVGGEAVDRRDLAREPAVVGGLGGLAVRVDRELVELGARDLPLLGDQLGADALAAHVVVVLEGLGERRAELLADLRAGLRTSCGPCARRPSRSRRRARRRRSARWRRRRPAGRSRTAGRSCSPTPRSDSPPAATRCARCPATARRTAARSRRSRTRPRPGRSPSARSRRGRCARAASRDGRPCSSPSPDARARSRCGRLRRSRPRGSRWSPLSFPNSRLVAYHRSQIGSRIRSAIRRPAPCARACRNRRRRPRTGRPRA